MKRKRLHGSAIVVACVISLLLAVRYDRTHIVRGLLRNEAFFRGYPTSYWREIIGAEGRAGALDVDTAVLFEDPDAVPVLLECVADRDPKVRWPSVMLLWRAGSARQAEPVLRRALDDVDLDVRCQAIRGLARLRGEAMPAVPKLVELSKDDDLDVSTGARYALWEIDPETARTAGGWQEFSSAKWEFSVMMPGTPEEDLRFVDTLYGELPLHMFRVSYGVVCCIVGISEYPPEMTEDCPLQERFDSSAEETAAMYGGSLMRYDPIEQHGYCGREKVVEVEGQGTSRTRMFPVGRRAYQVSITSPPGDVVSPKAEEFFLGSLRITYAPEPAAEDTNVQDDP